MRIALFASSYFPCIGGVEEHCRQLAREYQREGHKVIVLTNRWPRSMPLVQQLEHVDVYRIAFRVPGACKKSRLTFALTHRIIQRQVARILRGARIDLVHVHCVSANAHYARLAASRLHTPLVVTTHGEITMDAGQLFQTSRFMNQVLSKVVDAADAITACSEKSLADAEAHLNKNIRHKSSVVYNGINPADFSASTPIVCQTNYILAMGRLVRQKGFEVLLHAVALLEGSAPMLLLAGDGPEAEPLKALSKQLKIDHRVTFVGQADRPTVAALFKGCDFFVLPSLEEPFGIVNLEAMINGKAVVASRVGGVPEIVLDKRTGVLVPPADPQALAVAIRGLLENPSLQHRLGEAGKERALTFSWTATAKQYLDIYRRCSTGRQDFHAAGSNALMPAVSL